MYVTTMDNTSLEDLLLAMSQLLLLTELNWLYPRQSGGAQHLPHPAAVAFTALTASSNPRALTLRCHRSDVLDSSSPVLF
jgi:hypothetical protein